MNRTEKIEYVLHTHQELLDADKRAFERKLIDFFPEKTKNMDFGEVGRNCFDTMYRLQAKVSEDQRIISMLQDVLDVPEDVEETNITEALKVASVPMVDFVNKWCCPHDTIIIQQGHVELLSGEITFPTKILD